MAESRQEIIGGSSADTPGEDNSIVYYGPGGQQLNSFWQPLYNPATPQTPLTLPKPPPGWQPSNALPPQSSVTPGAGTSNTNSSPNGSNASTLNGMSPYTWAVALLQGIGAPTSATNIEVVMSWELAEGGNWNNAATANPLNTTEPGYGGIAIAGNSAGVMAYPTWQSGLQATEAVLLDGSYDNIVSLLKEGNANPGTIASAIESSPWGTQAVDPMAAGVQAPWTGGTIVAPNATIGSGSNLNNGLQQAATPSLSLDALRSQDPLVAALVMAVPELTQIFQEAVAQTWSTDQFTSAIQNSNWWKTHSATARQLIAEQYADPATWQMTVSNLEATLVNFAAQLGAQPTAQQINQLAVNALMGGYDQNQAYLRQQFEQYIQPVAGNHFAGEAGTDEQQLRQNMLDLGVFLPENVLAKDVAQIVGGQSDVNSVSAQLRAQAQARYPAYSQLLNEGVNTSDIADPYIQQAQSLLEQGPGAINIQSPLIQNVLTAPNPVSLTDFENTVRQQPQWLATNNAQTSIMQTAHQVLTDFGFMT